MTESAIHAAMESIRDQGPCAFCGGPYAAHRLIDAQMAMFNAGETVDSVGDWYECDTDDMLARWIAYGLLRLGKRGRRRRPTQTR